MTIIVVCLIIGITYWIYENSGSTLVYERKLDKLKEFYSDLEKQEYNKLEVVKEFNAINEEYTNKIEELRKIDTDESAIEAGKILSEEMVNAATLRVPLAIDIHSGKDWYEAK